MGYDHSLDFLRISPDRRLALAYALRGVKPLFLGLFALDARLNSIVQSAREPLLAQLKLAWWREQLQKPPGQRAAGEPLLAVLEPWGEAGNALSALTEGWEQLLTDEPLNAAMIQGFCQARGQAVQGLAGLLGADGDEARCAGEWWGLGDLHAAASSEDQRARIAAIAQDLPQSRPGLNRNMRPLLVLHGLARRSLLRGRRAQGAGGLLLAMRLGMLGI